MLKIAVTGTTGRMGEEIITAINAAPEIMLVAALVRSGHALVGKQVNDYIKLNNNKDLTFSETIPTDNSCDVVIDFSSPAATINYVTQCIKLLRPMVIGTTGLNDGEKNFLQQAAATIPIVFAPNMSLGVNICYELLAKCAQALGANWQLAISELHHKHKKDVPSGTALKMGEIMATNSGVAKSAIQFNSIRAGDVVGEHTALFIGDGENIAITHRATNRQAFAQGAVKAAHWLLGKPPMLYTMHDVIRS